MTDKIQESIIEEFSNFTEWEEKYEHIISLGKSMESMPKELKNDNNIIKGCQSSVWMHSELVGDKVIFKGDSDSFIVKGLVSLLIKTFSDKTPDQIINIIPYFIDKTGLRAHLSSARSNGLSAMVKQMKIHAIAYKTKLK